MAASPPRIFYCRCAHTRVVPGCVKDRTLEALARSSASFDAVPDLCALAARRDPWLAELARSAEEGDSVCVVACFSRAVRSLFDAAGATLPARGVQVLNMREQTADEIASALSPAEPGPVQRTPSPQREGTLRTEPGVKSAPHVLLYEGPGSQPLQVDVGQLLRSLLEAGYTASRAREWPHHVPPGRALLVLTRASRRPPELARHPGATLFQDVEGLDLADILEAVERLRPRDEAASPQGWNAWFPVIDAARCTGCNECLSFCLFSVYGTDSQGRLVVESPENCKTGCPACARVCPQVAILFPKYARSPINGAEVDDDNVRREGMKVDVSSLLGGNVYALLRGRSQQARSRFSLERDEDRAREERKRCLEGLRGVLDIPPEVFAALPSPEEILARARDSRGRGGATRGSTREAKGPSEPPAREHSP